MVGKIIFCSAFPGIPDKAGRKTTRRRRTQAIAKRYAFHANPISNHINIYFFITAVWFSGLTNSANIFRITNSTCRLNFKGS